MHLFLTNDDGIQADGLRQLAAAAVAAGHRVTVVAPDRERSAASHSLTVAGPLRVWPVDLPGARAFAVNGGPADCARLGLTELVDQPVDLVISGINRGANQGVNCIYSGTIGGAVEAALLGYPALASSLCSFTSRDYGTAARVSLAVGDWLVAHRLPDGITLNLNTPDLPYDQLKGWRWVPLAQRLYDRVGYELVTAPHGQEFYFMADHLADEVEADSDAGATQAGFVSLSPLTWDMTWSGPVDLADLAI